ncbi:unnamed protein product, partial [marine sediment metagenome]
RLKMIESKVKEKLKEEKVKKTTAEADVLKRKRKTLSNSQILMMLLISVWLLTVVIIPVATMLNMSFKQVEGFVLKDVFTVNNYLKFFKVEMYWRLFLKSFRMAFIVSIVAIIISYPLTYFVARRMKKFKNILFMLIIVPLWVSYLIRIIALRSILGNRGFLNVFLMQVGIIKEPLEIFLYNQFAVIITLIYIAIPFVSIPLYTALEKIPDALISASRDLGASGARTFIHVILPLSRPGLVTGFMLSFIIALGDYIIPKELG